MLKTYESFTLENYKTDIKLAKKIVKSYSLKSKINISKKARGDNFADYDFDTNTINLLPSYPDKREFLITILHEVSHAMDSKKMGKDEFVAAYTQAGQKMEDINKDFHDDNPFEISAEDFAIKEVKKWLDLDENKIPKGYFVDLVHAYDDEGIWGTGTIVKGKDKKIKGILHHLVRFSTQSYKYFPADKVKLVESIQSEHEGEKVVIFPGRFQPMHKGHINGFETASKMFGARVVVIQIVSKNKKSPIKDKSLLLKMNKDVAKANKKFIADILVKPDNVGYTIPQYVTWLRSIGYNPFGLGCGDDRYAGYLRQVEYLLSDKSDTPTDHFEIKVVEDRSKGKAGVASYSGTKTRQAFKDGDDEAIKDMLPKEIYKYKDKIAKHLAESFLFEGGNAVKDSRPIEQSEIPKTLDYINKKVFPMLGLEGLDKDAALIGSAGKKSTPSGDLDIAVSVDRVAGNNGISMKEALGFLDMMLKGAGYSTSVAFGFQQVSFACPIEGNKKNGYCQADLMLSDSLEWAKFVYYSPDLNKAESKYGGAYRTIMLMSIASLCEREATKVLDTGEIEEYESLVMRLNQGIVKVRKSYKGKKGLLKTPKLMRQFDKFVSNVPEEVTEYLFGEGTKVSDIDTFEKIYALLLSPSFPHQDKVDDILEKYEGALNRAGIPLPSELN